MDRYSKGTVLCRSVKDIDKVIAKAIDRTHWYAKNFPGAGGSADEFKKRINKQFWGVIEKWVKKHDLTAEQEKYLNDNIPSQFKTRQ